MMACADCPLIPNGTRKRSICCLRAGTAAGRELRVGDRVPMPQRKLDIRPAFTGESKTSFKPARGPKRL